ncbi:MAG: IS110 family transposase [Spirochaetes bacterium]|jgi:transposase|nr:IS110 family transposase [Spirochaetota bacterium]
MNNNAYVALDVHKNTIVAAISPKAGESTILGDYTNSKSGLKQLLSRLSKLSSDYEEIRICYEAGPCGYEVKRILEKNKYPCEIIAPSLIPQRAGDRIKTDKRDALKLARLYRAGELTAIAVPTELQESVRDLVRCREDISRALLAARQKANHFLIRHGCFYEGRNWTKGYFAWMKGIEFENRYLKETLNQYITHIEHLYFQLEDIDREMAKIAESDEYKTKVDALKAYRGINTLSAMVLITEVVSFRRFGKARELMSYIGIVPSEYSSGGTIKKGALTKCGNKRVRRILVEAAWHNRHDAKVTYPMKVNLKKIDAELRNPPLKALKRLNKRYYHLIFAGKPKSKAAAAVARELAGFIWHSMVIVESRLCNN